MAKTQLKSSQNAKQVHRFRPASSGLWPTAFSKGPRLNFLCPGISVLGIVVTTGDFILCPGSYLLELEEEEDLGQREP